MNNTQANDVVDLMNRASAAEARVKELEYQLELETWPDDDDRPLPEDAAIAAAHPLETGHHDLYQTAMRIVGARRSKHGLVELVNWLLLRVVRAEGGASLGSEGEPR